MSSTIRSGVIFSSTTQKLALLAQDHHNLLQCVKSISSEAQLDSESSTTTSQVDRLRVKANLLNSVHLANDSSTSQVARDALDYLNLVDGTVDISAGEWDATIDEETKRLLRRVEHAAVYGDVLKEWLDEQREVGELDQPLEITEPTSAAHETPTSEPLPTTRFQPATFLEEHSISAPLRTELETLAAHSKVLSERLLVPDYIIYKEDVSSAIRTLGTDARLYSNSTRDQIMELGKQPMMLDELASSFTSRWRKLDEWAWPVEGVQGNYQKHMSGKERNFLDLDIYEAIFLEVVGQKWSEHFKDELTRIRGSDAWPQVYSLQGLESGQEKKVESVIEMLDQGRKDERVSFERGRAGLAHGGRTQVKERFASAMNGMGGYEGYEGSTPVSPVSGWTGVIDASRTAAIHSHTFRHMRADIAVSRELAPELDVAVLHGDLANFGLSIPHDVTLDTLRYFGISDQWISWFEKYLKVPNRSADGSIKVAERGTPFGMTISTVVNELLLALLDIALVSEAGIAVHRQHDDVWVWSAQSDRVATAWSIMQNFTTQTGLAWNKEKTSCTIISGLGADTKPMGEPPLPGLKWGVLRLLPNGSWVADEEKLLELASAIKEDLASASKKSFLSVVGIWNRYHGYIVRNIGPVTNTKAFGQAQLLRSTLRRFHQLTLGENGIYDTLIRHFRDRFPQHETYEMNRAVLEWPIGLGGFTLHPHLVRIAVCDAAITETKELSFEDELTSASRSYESVCRAWESEWGERSWFGYQGDEKREIWKNVTEKPPIFSETAYKRWYALHSDEWARRYEQIKTPVAISSDDISVAVQKLYLPWTRGFGTSCERLVSDNLVPIHAALEVELATRNLFSSIPGLSQ